MKTPTSKAPTSRILTSRTLTPRTLTPRTLTPGIAASRILGGVLAWSIALSCGAAQAVAQAHEESDEAAKAKPAKPTEKELRELPRHKYDRYTKHDPGIMARAGYVSFGPFPFGQRGDDVISSEVVEKHLSYDDLIWVETAHFRIGCSLDSWAIPNDILTRKSYRIELERLAEKIPAVRPKIRARVLDPWLRLHLTAQRMEELYAEMQRWLMVKDSDFPASPEDKVYGETYMGEGPYLGMKDKFLLLVTEKGSAYHDYLKSFTGRQSKIGQRWHFTKQGSLFYGMAFELMPDQHDRALHNDIVFNVTINMVDGFRHYSYDLPVWIREGLGHWFQRRNNPKWNSFDQDEAAPFDPPNKWDWEPYVRQLLNGHKWSKFSEVIQWRHYGDINFVDHVMLWARTDFLMSFGEQKFHDFMFEIKGRYDHKTGRADDKDLVGAVRDAMQKVYGLNPITFDSKFEEWAIENYSTR